VAEIKVLWEDEAHKFVWLGAGDPEREKGIPSNQYAVVDGGEIYLLDPGGYHVFDRVFDQVCKLGNLDSVKALFLSHQDPDICASLVSWMEIRPDATVYLSRLWERFVSHLALPTTPRFSAIPDEGMAVELPSGSRLLFVPAHFLHSPGNFMVYDERSKILFTADVGAAPVAATAESLFVEDFAEHAKLMLGFHRRYLASNRAVENCLRHLRKLDVQVIAPQHGRLFKDAAAGDLLSWLEGLDVGMDCRDWGAAE
jgi:flavorubredoxin